MAKLQSLHPNVVLLASHVKAMRPRQWTKNLIIFAAPLFAFSLSLKSLQDSVIAFFLFCFISSSFYLLNDALDYESDRTHPTKCSRPIASGRVSIHTAIMMSIMLMSISLMTAWSKNMALGTIMTIYAIVQFAYNFKLKHIAILDVCTIAFGFVLRAYAGAAANQIWLSSWFVICTAMLALFLAIEKRKAELRMSQISARKTRKVLHDYSTGLLNRMEGVVSTATLIFYTLWSSGPHMGGASTSSMLLTVPFVIYGIFRYQMISEPKENLDFSDHAAHGSERPDEVLLRDTSILFTVLCWAITCFIVLYLKSNNWIQ
jgi:decaprenyl-phosphate phosphoribosyltransferase